jgi:hypothetical protein
MRDAPAVDDEQKRGSRLLLRDEWSSEGTLADGHVAASTDDERRSPSRGIRFSVSRKGALYA